MPAPAPAQVPAGSNERNEPRQGCESRSDGVRRRFRRRLQGELAARLVAESRSLVAAGEAPKPSLATKALTKPKDPICLPKSRHGADRPTSSCRQTSKALPCKVSSLLVAKVDTPRIERLRLHKA
jgi:hypothetical protein